MNKKIVALIISAIIIFIAFSSYVYVFTPQEKPIDLREQGMYDLHKSIIEEIYPKLKGQYEKGKIDKITYIKELENLERNRLGIIDEVLKEDFDDPKIKEYFYSGHLKNESVISKELDEIKTSN